MLALIGSGTAAAFIRLPTLASLWQTSYGKALSIKIVLLACALLLAAVNLLRTRPALQAAGVGPSAALLLRRLVSGEVVLVASAIFAAAVLSSLPPPAKALANLGKPSATGGPGPVTEVVDQNGYRLEFHVSPNRVGLSNAFGVRVLRGSRPVHGLAVTATFTMLDMDMPTLTYSLPERGSGLYERKEGALVMVGRWALTFGFQAPHGPPFQVLLIDHANG